MARKIAFKSLLFLCLTVFASLAARGAPVEVGTPVLRVVALTPALAAMCYEVLPADEAMRVVGVSEHARPPQGQRPRVIASSTSVDPEKLLTLRPDVVLYDPRGAHVHLRSVRPEAKVRWLPISTVSLGAVAAAYRMLGKLLSHAERGEALAVQFEGRLSGLKGKLSGGYFFQLDGEPLVAVGARGDFLPELLAFMGAGNVFTQLQQPYPRVSEESVVARDPDSIVVIGLRAERGRFERFIQKWRTRHPGMRAVRSDRVFLLDGDRLTLPGLSSLDGAAELAALVNSARSQERSFRD